MRLEEIIRDSGVIEVKGNPGISIGNVCNDSRKVTRGDLFIAVKGHGTDGHAYIGKAIASGAAAIVYEDDTVPEPVEGVEGVEGLFIAFSWVSSKSTSLIRLFATTYFCTILPSLFVV